MRTTEIYLNTWGAYNNGCIGYGWMSADEAEDFINENPERDGGEWFIADIDNYLGIEFKNLEYCNVMDTIETIKELEDMEEYERNEIIALMEYLGTEDVQEALDSYDDHVFYSDIDSYHDCMDEIIEMQFNNVPAEFVDYFDFEAYHRDCDFDIYEASNGCCVA